MAMVNFCDNCLKKKEEGQLSRVINSHALGNSYLKRLRPSAPKKLLLKVIEITHVINTTLIKHYIRRHPK